MLGTKKFEYTEVTYLFKEFLFDGDVVVRNAQNNQTVFRFFTGVAPLGAVSHYQVVGSPNIVLRNQFVLD